MESTLQSGISCTTISNTPRSSFFGFGQIVPIFLVAICVLLLPSLPASAVEKWVQLPDLSTNGIDIRMDNSDGLDRLLADDFRCTTRGAITGIDFWGSWKNDIVGQLFGIHLSIHEDIPADPNDPDSYSRPGDQLWTMNFTQNQFTISLYHDLSEPNIFPPDFEWWWDPYDPNAPADPFGDQKVWLVQVDIDPSMAFVQEGSAADPLVLWLDISVLTEVGFEFGWKTSDRHWNDDAVFYAPGGAGSAPDWFELIYPTGHPLDPNSIDLAFSIHTTPPDPGVKKWLQEPDLSTEGIDIRMDNSDGVDRLLADDFECRTTGLITGIQFWGSWNQDNVGFLTGVHLSIHKDIPADPNGPNNYSRPGAVLWEKDFTAGEFTESLYFQHTPANYEWWWDPYVTPSLIPDGDQQVWLVNVPIDPSMAFPQEGIKDDPIVYWLDIAVQTDPNFAFGWKTSNQHWNDDAVFGVPGAGWNELIYPLGHPFEPNSIDLAFCINTISHTVATEACCVTQADGTIFCVDVTPAECLAAGGHHAGPGTVCLGDVNGNGIDDVCEDCNGNGILDAIDIGTGFSSDCNGNGIPDECEPDCNGNGIPDDCDITSGFSLDVNANGIPDECEPIPACEPDSVVCDDGTTSLIIPYLAGLNDSFILPVEVASPDPPLFTYITTCSAPGTPLQFDEIPGDAGVPANSWLGHTFINLPVGIVGATLEFRARATTGAGSGGTFNDHIAIVDSITGCAPVFAWQKRFENLPEAGGTWNPGQTATFCLDLTNLPTNAGPVSVLSQLNSGRLSIRVDDDTGIDYMILTLAVCPCEYRFPFEYLGGKDDICGDYKGPFEPASPSMEMTNAFEPPPLRKFGQSLIMTNRRFAHTFSGLPPGIVAAELEICMRASNHDKTRNDVLSLEFLNPSFAWSRSIIDLTEALGTWKNGQEGIFFLDLADLQPSNVGVIGVTNIIGALADGDLDISVQDDTAVDYIKLRIWVCCKKIIPGDVNLDGVVNVLDFVIMAGHFTEIMVPWP